LKSDRLTISKGQCLAEEDNIRRENAKLKEVGGGVATEQELQEANRGGWLTGETYVYWENQLVRTALVALVRELGGGGGNRRLVHSRYGIISSSRQVGEEKKTGMKCLSELDMAIYRSHMTVDGRLLGGGGEAR